MEIRHAGVLFLDLAKEVKQRISVFRKCHLGVEREVDEMIITGIFELCHPRCAPLRQGIMILATGGLRTIPFPVEF